MEGVTVMMWAAQSWASAALVFNQTRWIHRSGRLQVQSLMCCFHSTILSKLSQTHVQRTDAFTEPALIWQPADWGLFLEEPRVSGKQINYQTARHVEQTCNTTGSHPRINEYTFYTEMLQSHICTFLSHQKERQLHWYEVMALIYGEKEKVRVSWSLSILCGNAFNTNSYLMFNTKGHTKSLFHYICVSLVV